MAWPSTREATAIFMRQAKKINIYYPTTIDNSYIDSKIAATNKLSLKRDFTSKSVEITQVFSSTSWPSRVEESSSNVTLSLTCAAHSRGQIA